MLNEILVSSERLAELMQNDQCVVLDCRFDLSDSSKGEENYLKGHLPAAHFANLNNDLSSPVTPSSGRHPLPATDQFAAFLGSIGWHADKLLVAHDDRNNAMAGRLWWLMRYFGLAAALLDGGLDAWVRSGRPVETGVVYKSPTAAPELKVDETMTVSTGDILKDLGAGGLTLIDARPPERYSGAVEPLDTKAGHIPGALNRPLGLNLDSSGCFKQPQQLQAEFNELLHQNASTSVVHSCGSGVTACHNQFAMELAGMGSTKVYPGSWSEWIREDSRPVESSC
jgi:thiosulfate/3-mercaptopyruvate sulfurtransferase